MATGYKKSQARKVSSENILKKFVYFFDEGRKEMKDLLGGKGAHLAEMTRIGIPVPFGFTISTEVCAKFLEDGKYPEEFGEQLQKNLEKLEKKIGKKLGSKDDPLLVSVRSGAAKSMPGMMDTILNLGLNDETVQALAEKTGNERFAYDCYRRFIQMFGDVVLSVKREKFEEALEKLKEEKEVKMDHELAAEDLKKLVEIYKKIVVEGTGGEFPKNPLQQLKMAIEAVFNSWNNERAKTYRKLHDITGLKGTAVNIQAMVFGNMGEGCGTGVAFTRNPSTGERELYGEFLINAQGEDVVAGIRTPQPILELESVNPEALEQLLAVRELLEAHYRDMQDIEFTIEKGKLFLLQTRSGKRTAGASVRIACDMVDEGLISKEEAILKVEAKQLNQLLHPQIKKTALREVLTKGLPASPGAACGKVVFTSERAIEMA
ncbi:MAG: PEP/pyruvate-binding domain-containing protein, partial [Candidatus Gracilibacteria bacterium]